MLTPSQHSGEAITAPRRAPVGNRAQVRTCRQFLETTLGGRPLWAESGNSAPAQGRAAYREAGNRLEVGRKPSTDLEEITRIQR
jgi:hypothetical protein